MPCVLFSAEAGFNIGTTKIRHRNMIKKLLSLLLVAFAMTANFCLAEDNSGDNSGNADFTTQIGITELNNCAIPTRAFSLKL